MMGINQILKFISTMKFVTFLYLTLSVNQLSVAHHTGKNFTRHVLADIDVWDIGMPDNSWWKGIQTTEIQYDTWRFDSIEYLKDIPGNSTIRLDYTVECSQHLLWGHSFWWNMYNGSTLLCTTGTPGSSIAALVRELLGIPEGCPVSAGEKRNTSGIHFPLKDKTLFLSSRTKKKEIRILVKMWENTSASAQMLFEAYFNLVYPVKILS